jgi:hypothetical protein
MDLAVAGSLINPGEAKVLTKLLAEYEVQQMNLLPRFPGKRRLRALCLWLAEMLKNAPRRDKREDEELGNIG